MPKDKEEKIEEVKETKEVKEAPETEVEVESEAVTDETAEVAEAEATPGADISDSNEQAIEPLISESETELGGPVTVKPVKFASFEDLSQAQGELNKNLEILMDIKLQLTVELGRTELPIKKVLELTRGSIIELEKVAGEPVELYANGKLVAHGEVVVIEDNFGLRITSITEPEDRLKGIG